MTSRIAATALLALLLPAEMAGQDPDRIANATGGMAGAPEVGFVAQALGVSGDIAAILLKDPDAKTRLLPPAAVEQIGNNAGAILGVLQVGVNVYQNKEVQWSDVASLAVTLGAWRNLIPPPFGTYSQLAIMAGQAVQANNQAGRDLNYEVSIDYYRGAGGGFARSFDPNVVQGGAPADQFIENQLDPRTRTGDFTAAFTEYCQRRYHVDHVPLLIQQIDERRQNGQAPIPGELRGLARRFLNEQKGVYHVNNEITRMRAFVQQNLTQIRALSDLAQRLRDDPEFIARYKQFYREQTGRDEAEDEGGADKYFRVHLVSGYDDRPLGFRSVMLTSSERVLSTNEEGLTPYAQAPRQLQSIEVVATAPDHEGFAASIPLSGASQQTVDLKLEPESVEFVVSVTSGGQPVDDATVRMLGPAGRLQVEAAPGGRAVFKLRPGAWVAQVTSPTHSEARQPVGVPLGRAGSATVALKRTVPATPTVRPTVAPKGKRGEWVRDGEVETRPPAPWKGLTFTPKTGTSVRSDVYNGDVIEHNWNAPPPTLTAAGWTAALTVNAQTVPGGREYPILCVDGRGFKEPSSSDAVRVPNQCATCLAEAGKGCSGNKSFHMTPREDATTLEITIGATYVVSYIYRYKQAQ
jgi:hypothetical protein